MLDRLRGIIGSATLRMGRAAARVMPSPTAWTLTGLVFSLVAAVLFSDGQPFSGVIAGLMVLISGFFDLVDGAVARATGTVSRRARSSIRFSTGSARPLSTSGSSSGAAASPALVCAALALSLLVSHARAKADSLGVSLAGVGIGERSERLVVLILAALFGVIPLGVLIVAVLAGITFVERVVRACVAIR